MSRSRRSSRSPACARHSDAWPASRSMKTTRSNRLQSSPTTKKSASCRSSPIWTRTFPKRPRAGSSPTHPTTLRRSPSPRRTTTRLRPTDMSGNAKAASPPPRAHSSNTPPQHPCSIPARSGNSPSITMRTDSSRSKRVSIRTEASFRTMKALISTRTKPRTTARRSSEPSWISRVSQKKR